MDRSAYRDLGRFSANFAIFLLVLVVGGFGLNLAAHPDIIADTGTIHHIHALIMLSWYVLLIVQPLLIARSASDLHRRLGRTSVILAAAVVGAGFAIIRYNYLHRGGTIVPALDLFVMVNFLSLYAGSLVEIGRTPRSVGAHQRLMLMTGVAMSPPAIARFAEAVGIGNMAAVPIVLVLAFTLAGHDLLAERRLHPASLVGGAMIVAGVVAALAIADAEWWSRLLTSVYGPPSL